MAEENDKPAVVSGAFVKISTMADGTPRIVVDLSCTLTEAAALGLVPGAPIALARLTQEAAKALAQQQTIKAAEEAGHGKDWALLYKAGTFFAPELHNVLGIEEVVEQLRRKRPAAGNDIVECVKEAIYEAYGVESLTELDPARFRSDLRANGIERILPKEFGG